MERANTSTSALLSHDVDHDDLPAVEMDRKSKKAMLLSYKALPAQQAPLPKEKEEEDSEFAHIQRADTGARPKLQSDASAHVLHHSQKQEHGGLLQASKGGDAALVKAQLDAGASVDMVDSEGLTALHVA